MAARSVQLCLLVLLQLIVSCILPGAEAATFSVVNKCPFDVYAGVLPNSGQALLGNGGFKLNANGGQRSLDAPAGWSGRLWGRTGCRFDPATQRGPCETGDCGGEVACNGRGGAPPATLAEILLNGYQNLDFYDISLVDGYNLPMAIAPRGGSGDCVAPSCTLSLPNSCAGPLQVQVGGRLVACKSACVAFGTPQYCCTPPMNTPQTCPPTQYSKAFKAACPQAYSYAFDDPTSTFTCKGANYDITFCPSGIKQIGMAAVE